MKCMLIGNFGVGNLGDEALKEYFLGAFPDIDWVVLGEDVPRLPGGLRSLLSLQWIKTLKAFRTCEAVVFGGGSLFTDSESVYACLLWYVHALASRLYGKPIHYAFQGVGPFRTRVGGAFARKSFGYATSISVRDSASARRVESWRLGKKIVQSFDPVITVINKEKYDVRSENVLVLIPRKNSSDKFAKEAQKAFESRSWDDVRVVAMQYSKKSESDFCQKLASTLGSVCHIVDAQELDDLAENISDASLVVTERYHGALVALCLEKETQIVSQCDGDKLSSLQGGLPDTHLVQTGFTLLNQAFH